MPLVNTWIKNEDWDSYYQLASNKQWGEFIHNALNATVFDNAEFIKARHGQEGLDYLRHEGKQTIKPKIVKSSPYAVADTSLGPRVIKTPEDAVKKVFPGTEAIAKLCKHGKIVNQCKVYGCPHYI